MWEWPISPTRSSWASSPASAWSVESTYSQTGSRGEAWERPTPPMRGGRLERGEELERLLADVLPRPLDGRRRCLGEDGDVERPKHRQVVVADQAGG